MRVPLSWLREWIAPDAPVEEIAERLTRAGLEVDAIERTGPDLGAFVVGFVREREKHPDADRLSVCRVDLGDGDAHTIVCGAPNVAAGQKVAVARPGTVVLGRKLGKSKIRGVSSHGMICSAAELELADESDGILVLPEDAPVGAPLDRVLAAGDAVLDVAITANRGDCASMLGIAREVRAAFGGVVALPPCDVAEAGPPVERAVAVAIEAPDLCHRYAARVVRGVRIAPSPAWLARRLEAAGLRPIDVVVDVTNLVLHELGQPLHAFDLAKLRGGRVVARRATDGERIETLDGRTRALAPDDLVIADAERAVAIAGVMGSANSEVDAATVDVLLESAHFAPRAVRRTARRLGLHSEASYRFERGVDRAGVERALDRAARLLAELAGGVVDTGRAVATGDAPDVVEGVSLETARVNRLLGTDLGRDAIAALLGAQDIACAPRGADALACAIPTHRNDLRIPADLVEEVARMHGYDAIEPRALEGVLGSGAKPAWLELGDAIRDAFAAEGLTEVATFPFLDAAALDALGLDPGDPRRAMPRVVNPIAESESALRSTHVPALLALVRDNRSRQVDRVALFEVSRVFEAPAEAGALPRERWRATAVLARGREKRLWGGEAREPVFFEAKGVAERLVARLRRPVRLAASRAPEPYLHPGACADLLAGKDRVGVVGELHPAVAARFEIDTPVAVIEVDSSAVGDLPTRLPRYREVSRHPQSRRDLAVVLDRDQPVAEVLGAIGKKAGDALAAVEVFDRYEGPGVPEGKVSVAFRLVYQLPDRTLTDEEVSQATDRVVQMLQQRFAAELR